jgi:hypothetical protein
MKPSRNARTLSGSASVIDFAAVRTERLHRRMETAAVIAACVLARVEAGHAGWHELAAMLIAPFNG